MIKIIPFIILAVFTVASGSSQTSVTYDVTFTSIWNSTDHTSVPGNAHWSRLKGSTHNTANTFLQIGSLATTGIKNVAERGDNAVFKEEVLAEISNGGADQYINGPNLANATGNMLIADLVVTKEFPLLTLVSMIAPSPDWIIAVNGYSLLDAAGNWKTSETIDIFAYDAGTDSGTDYTSSNNITDPFQPISMINGSPIQGNKMGTLTISLKTALATKDFVLDKIRVFPNPASDGKINMNLEGVSLSKVEIFNTVGSQIKSMEEIGYHDDLIIDIQSLPSGLYILKLTTDKSKSFVKKFVVDN